MASLLFVFLEFEVSIIQKIHCYELVVKSLPKKIKRLC